MSLPRDIKTYNHSDGLRLLEPKAGDYVRLNGKCFGCRGRIVACADREYKLAKGTTVRYAHPQNIEAIEQRDGKPFFWPECEAA
jgi:hypothetical protein